MKQLKERELEQKRKRRSRAIIFIFFVLLLALAVLALCIGKYPITPKEALLILSGNKSIEDVMAYNVVFGLRLPRVIAAIICGAALSASGAAYQGIFRNPLVSSEFLGVSQGACVGAAIAILLFAVIEGYRADAEVPAGFQPVNNRDEWYCYTGLSQYLLFTTGKAYYEIPYPPVYNRTIKKKETDYPFSGFFISIPEDALGDIQGIPSALVSSRSMIVHMAANADLAIECYCRDKSTMGVMVTFKAGIGFDK
ncbi:MAG: iron ABC transporter permease [Firmicutes bacterium]|nr:iron ABC transporter permease [Bacillota bacterium]